MTDPNRFYVDPKAQRLEEVEAQIHYMARTGELFETESLDEDGIDTLESIKAQKILAEYRDLLVEVRPQGVDADGSEMAKEVAEIAKEFGLECDEDWKNIGKEEEQ